MQPKNSARFASFKVNTLALALASSCLFYSGADAAGLGKLTVLSALGQPLRAEIELTSVTKDDAGNMMPKLASAEAYRQANVEFSSSLTTLRFNIVERGSRHFVVVTSTQSVNEPFLEILVELNSGSGKLIREYTVLLDPVEMQASNAPLSTSNGTTVATQAPAASAPSAAAPVSSAATASPAKTAAQPAQASKNAAPTPESGSSYQIKSGDTLSKIANQYKPQGVSLEQMLVALQRSNSAAFIDNNMNLLRAGRILTIPDTGDIERTTQPEAKKIVLAQSADFATYRNRMAGQVEQAKPEKAVEPKKADSGKITAKVTEAPTPANEAKDKLKLSKAQEQQAKALEEDKIAKQRALDAANERVKELEANTAKLKNILDLKNKAASAASASAPVVAPVKPSVTPSVTATTATSLPAVEASVPASQAAAKPRPKVVMAPAAAPEPSLTDNLIKYLPYGAGLLMILGLVGVFVSKRKKKTDHFDDESILTGSSIKTNSLFGSTGGQSVDTNNSVFNSNFAPSASQLDANEVDPVAEADVYIAYGRDEQAEEILKEALRTQPDRQAVRVKLLEIYAHRKDTRTFETVAGELYGMTGGEGPDWAQAASLGIIIDPQNPLYAGGHTTDHSSVLGASTLPVESLDPEALLGNSLSQEMLDSLTAKNDGSHSMMMGGDGDINDRTHRTEEIPDGLDFDLGLSTNPEPEDDYGSTHSIPTQTTAKGHDVGADIPMHAFENELQVPEQHEPEPDRLSIPPATRKSDVHAETPAKAEEHPGMDFAALDFDFDIPKSKNVETSPAEVQSSHDDIAMHDSTHIDFTPKATASALDYDLSSISLDLPKTNDELSAALPNIPNENLNKTIPLESIPVLADELESSAEMATKLDLAVAYQEIGDKDGARELLEEVLKGGSEEQITRAKAMMHELA